MSSQIKRIVVLNLDSFTSGAGIECLLRVLGNKCVLLVESKRFGGKYGGVIKQSVEVFRRSGFNFLLCQAFNLLYYKFFVRAVQLIYGLDSRTHTLGQLAKEIKIKHIVTGRVRDKKVIDEIKNAKPDLIVSFYFDHIIPKSIVDIPKFGVVNVHTANLPECKGPFPVLCTFIKQTDPVITVHKITDELLDSGPILKQEKYTLPVGMDVLCTDRWVMRRAGVLLSRLICDNEDVIIGNGLAQEKGGFYMSYPNRYEISSLRKRGLKLWSLRSYFRNLR